MTKLYLGILLAAEVAAIGLVAYYASGYVAVLISPVLPLTLVVALFLNQSMSSPAYRVHRISPEDIIGYRTREAQVGPRELSRSIIERADEIHRTLLESPSEIQAEMCALGYRACVNDIITLTNLINAESDSAGRIHRFRLRRWRRRATDSLAVAREALPPGALRATRQEQQ